MKTRKVRRGRTLPPDGVDLKENDEGGLTASSPIGLTNPSPDVEVEPSPTPEVEDERHTGNDGSVRGEEDEVMRKSAPSSSEGDHGSSVENQPDSDPKFERRTKMRLDRPVPLPENPPVSQKPPLPPKPKGKASSSLTPCPPSQIPVQIPVRPSEIPVPRPPTQIPVPRPQNPFKEC